MKINRLLTAALITFATVFTGCVKESVWDRETGIDESKAAPEEFTYDEEASSKNSITVYWEGDKAVAAGAKSFLVQLTDPANMEKGDTWNSKVTKVLEVTDDENADYESATFSGLTEYDCYYVRIRANYPGSVYSPWVYITMEDGVTPALMQVGHGEMTLVPVVSVEALVTDINVAWTKCKDATKYIVEWRKTGDATWQSAETTEITYAISGLNDLTEYEVRVTNVTAAGNYTCDPVKATTKERPPFPMEIATADEWIAFATSEIIGLANNGPDDKITLTADLDFTGKEYPAGVEFKGLVDGNGKSIKNLQSSTPLFKQVSKVQNLTIDATCSFTSTTAATLASLAETSTGVISGVKNNAAVTVTVGHMEANTPYVVGGLVSYAYANIVDCENTGAVTVNAETANTGALGGIVAYTEAQVNNSKNTGAVKAAFGMLGAKVPVGKVTSAAPCVGGIAGLAQGAFSMNGNTNNGDVTYSVTDITLTGNINRGSFGGIVGAPNGKVERCTNTGDVTVSMVLPTRAAYSGYEAIACVGGIGGSDYHATAQGDRPAQSATDYVNCVNEGNVTLDSDVMKSNSAVGGIVGWPGIEGAGQVCVSENCINRGNVTVKGYVKARIGGLQGGMGNMIGCENYGAVVVEENVHKDSYAASLAGYNTYQAIIRNCFAGGSVETKGELTAMGGLIGANGNQPCDKLEGCRVNCVLKPGKTANYGLVIGRVNGGSKMTFGTAAAPITVAGTVGDVKVTASDYASYMHGAGNWVDGTHTIHAVYGE